MSEKGRQAAERLKALVESNDPALVPEVYADDATIWHSTDGVELSREQLAQTLAAIARVATCEVEVDEFHPTETGFVQTQKNTYRLSDGSSTEFHAALVVDVDDQGRISRVREYLDSAGLAPLVEALG